MEDSSSSSHGDDGINLPDVGVVGAASSSEGSPDLKPVYAPHLTAPTPSPQPPRLESTSSDDVFIPEAPRRSVRDSPSSQQRRTHIKQFLMDSDDSSRSESEGVDVPVFEESLDATKPPSHSEVPPPQPPTPTIATVPSSPSPAPQIDTSQNEEDVVVSVSGDESVHDGVEEVSITRPSPEPQAPTVAPNEDRKHLVSPVPVLSPSFSPTRNIPAPQPSPPRMPIRSAAFPNPKAAVRVETPLIATTTPANRASSSSGNRPKVKLIVRPRPASTVVRRAVPALPSTLEGPDGPPVKLTKSVQLRRSAANRLEGEWAAAQEGRPPPLPPVQPMFSAPERNATIYEVSLVSQRRRDERMEEQRRRCEASEGQHCTFAPTLSEGSEWLIKGMTTRRSVRDPSGPPARGPPPFYSSKDKDDEVNCTFVPTVTAASRRILEEYDQELRREGKEPLPASERLYKDRERRDRVQAEEAQRHMAEREREEESVMKPLLAISGAEEQALVSRVTHPHTRKPTHRKEVMSSPVRESVVLPESQVRAVVSRLNSTGAPVNRHRQSKDAPAPTVHAPEVSGVSRLMRDAQRDRVVGSWYELLFPSPEQDGCEQGTSTATRPIHGSISVLADAYPDLWDLVRTLGIYYQPDGPTTTNGVDTSASRALDFDTSVHQVGEQCWSRDGFIATILHEEREHGPQIWTHQAPSQYLRALSADPTLGQKKVPKANSEVFKRLSRDASVKAAMRAPVVERKKAKPATTPTKKGVRGGRAVDISSILATPGTSIVGRGGAPPQPHPLDTRPQPTTPTTPPHRDSSGLVSAAMELEALLMGVDPSMNNDDSDRQAPQQHREGEEGGSPGTAAHRAPTEAPENGDVDSNPNHCVDDAFDRVSVGEEDEYPMPEVNTTPSPHNQSLSFQDPDPLPASTPPKPTPPTPEGGGVLLTLADATYHHGVVHRPDVENEAPLPITHSPRHGPKAPLAELVLGAHDLQTIQRLAQRLAAKQMASGAPHRKGSKLRISAHSTPAEF